MEDSTSKAQPIIPIPGSLEHRAAVVAGIRALADFIETRTDLPVPDGASAQYSELDRSQAEQVVRQAAAALGAEPRLHSTNDAISTRHIVVEHGFPDYFKIEYTVHGFLPTEPEISDRTVTEAGRLSGTWNEREGRWDGGEQA